MHAADGNAPVLRSAGGVKLILIGPPGAGKGTLAARLDGLGLRKVSSGSLFRAEVEKQTSLGRVIKDSLAEGNLVPDEPTLQLMRRWFWSRPTRQGFILDGFPRTVVQARALDEWLEARDETLTACLFLQLSEEEAVRRITHRRVCPQDGKNYNLLFHPPIKENVCDDCGSELVQRADDREETARYRYQIFRDRTRQVISYYRDQGILSELDASKSMDVTVQQVVRRFFNGMKGS